MTWSEAFGSDGYPYLDGCCGCCDDEYDDDHDDYTDAEL